VETANFTKNLMVELDWEIVDCMFSRVEWDRKIKEITKNNYYTPGSEH
jgi:hypothetical protein